MTSMKTNWHAYIVCRDTDRGSKCFSKVVGKKGIASGIEIQQLHTFFFLHDYAIFDDILCLRHMSAVVGIFVNTTSKTEET